MGFPGAGRFARFSLAACGLALAVPPVLGQTFPSFLLNSYNRLNQAPLPASPYELAAAPITTLTTPDERAPALALLSAARAHFTLLSQVAPPFQWAVSYQASGFAAGDGLGGMQEIWLGNGAWAWTASQNGIPIDRYAYHGLYSSNRTPVPMAMQMVREAMFWPIQYYTDARIGLRSASIRFQGRTLACILVGNPGVPEPPDHRGWMEAEYCIEPSSGLLQIASQAPGIYEVYDYGETANFHGYLLARSVNVIAAGQTAVAIRLDNLSDADGVNPATIRPTPAMVALGPSYQLGTPERMMLPSRSFGADSSPRAIALEVTVSPGGHPSEVLPLNADDAQLALVAAQRAETIHYATGNRNQEELFLILVF